MSANSDLPQTVPCIYCAEELAVQVMELPTCDVTCITCHNPHCADPARGTTRSIQQYLAERIAVDFIGIDLIPLAVRLGLID